MFNIIIRTLIYTKFNSIIICERNIILVLSFTVFSTIFSYCTIYYIFLILFCTILSTIFRIINYLIHTSIITNISWLWISIIFCTLINTNISLWIIKRWYFWTINYTLISIQISIIWMCIITNWITIFITIIYMILTFIITFISWFWLCILSITLFNTFINLYILISTYLTTVICTLFWILTIFNCILILSITIF